MTTPPAKQDPARELRRLLTRLDLAAAGRELGRVVGVKVAARLVGVSERFIVQAIRTRQLQATRLGKDSQGRDYVVRISAIRRYLQRRRPRGRPRRGPGRPRKGTRRFP